MTARRRRTHLHPANRRRYEQRTRGEWLADSVTAVFGSWRFIIVQTLIVAAWTALNLLGALLRWDPYPFILLNLVFSTQAAYAAPLILLSQNRQAETDRLAAERLPRQPARPAVSDRPASRRARTRLPVRPRRRGRPLEGRLGWPRTIPGLEPVDDEAPPH
ncbi:DUF1003 domain-containing protein [Spirillospora sp. NPDC000708]